VHYAAQSLKAVNTPYGLPERVREARMQIGIKENEKRKHDNAINNTVVYVVPCLFPFIIIVDLFSSLTLYFDPCPKVLYFSKPVQNALTYFAQSSASWTLQPKGIPSVLLLSTHLVPRFLILGEQRLHTIAHRLTNANNRLNYCASDPAKSRLEGLLEALAEGIANER